MSRDNFPRTDWKTAAVVTFVALVVAFIIVQYVVGADDFIYWVAGLIA